MCKAPPEGRAAAAIPVKTQLSVTCAKKRRFQVNELIFFLSIAAAFTSVVLVARFFGKVGLYAWISIAVVLANLLIPKVVTLFGLDVNLGSVMFSSLFLATDILSERFGLKDSRRAVVLALISDLLFIAVTQIGLLYVPSEMDMVHNAMKDLFTIELRVTAASVLMMFLANLADVYLFEAMRRRSEKHLWLRNNVCTILCNCTENFIFVLLALWGIYSFGECMALAAVGCIIEIVISVCDTPFVYWGRKVCKTE